MDISIVIPVFNCLHLTRACVETVEQTIGDRRDFEVIISDDGSTDGTTDWVGTLAPERYRLVRSEQNTGYAGAVNRAAHATRSRLLLLLNNDTLLLPGWLEPMLTVHATAARVGVVGNIQRKAGTGLIDHAGVRFMTSGYPLHVGSGASGWPRGGYRRWPAVTAACCLIERASFQHLGGLDCGYRNGYEDVDFCLRAGEAGLRHYVAQDSVIEHHVSASPGRLDHEDQNLTRFLERWREKLQAWAASVPAESIERDLERLHEHRRSDALRYLRKHAHRPWRYNGTRLVRAVRSLLARPPRPALPAVEEHAFFVRP